MLNSMNSEATSYPAHIRGDGAVQTVVQHCHGTAEIASNALVQLQLGRAGRLAGLIHDMGKLQDEFAKYISDAVAGISVRRGSVNHTFAGVKYLLDTFHGRSTAFTTSDVACELLAFAVGAHHGLFDIVNTDGQSGFQHRLDYGADSYTDIKERFHGQCANPAEIRELFNAASDEIERYMRKISDLPKTTDNEKANEKVCFYLGLLARLLLSAVMEGDRRDTAVFMGTRPDEMLPGDRASLWQSALDNLERYIGKMPCNTLVNKARYEISNLCRAFSDHPQGLYRLNVPTGGGKTLSGLRFALAHAKQQGMKRIFYVAPLISILEQNADVIRCAVGHDDWVLEHHSNVVRENADEDELEHMRLYEETWDAPVIVTTMVQLLDALYSGKPACIRRFHALTNSVILIDEVQTVPFHMLSVFNMAMNFLAGICSSTIILCSATQPRLEETRHALQINTETPVPFDAELWQPFVRTRILDAGSKRLDEIPAVVDKAMSQARNLLLVCNKKGEAEEMYFKLQRKGRRCFHLSASMCIAHRRETLTELYKALEHSRDGGPGVICVSTQVIEAGVDISFDCVIRMSAGMDSVVQSAGRCNRNGESEIPAPVWLVNCENEKLTGLEAIQRGKKATNSLLYAFQQDSKRFMNDLASQEAIDFYYQALYSDIRSDGENRMDYPVDNPCTTLVDLLSYNLKNVSDGSTACSCYLLRQAFRTAGDLFSVFGNDSVDVIVPWRGGKIIIDKLMNMDSRWQLKEIGELIRQAKPFTVSLYAYQVRKLMNKGALFELCGGSILALTEGYYSDETGLISDRAENCFLEV